MKEKMENNYHSPSKRSDSLLWISNVDETEAQSRLDELREILADVLDELVEQITHLRKEMLVIRTTDEVVRNQGVAQAIIAVKKVLEPFPAGTAVYHSLTFDNEEAQAMSSKLISFLSAMDHAVWEIRIKLLLIKEFLPKPVSLSKTLILAATIKKLKKILSKDPKEGSFIVGDDQQDEESWIEKSLHKELEEKKKREESFFSTSTSLSPSQPPRSQEKIPGKVTTPTEMPRSSRRSARVMAQSPSMSDKTSEQKQAEEREVSGLFIMVPTVKSPKGTLSEGSEEQVTQGIQAVTLSSSSHKSQKEGEGQKESDANGGGEKGGNVDPEKEENRRLKQRLMMVINAVHDELDSRLANLKLKFRPQKSETQSKLEDVLLLVRVLKDIRQVMIQYNNSYEYPTLQDLIKTTQKITHLHQLGQGKLAIIQELASNTLVEVRSNLEKFKRDFDGRRKKQLLEYARFLRDIKMHLDRVNPAKRKKITNLGERLNSLKVLLTNEANQSNKVTEEEKLISEMQEKISYLNTKYHLLRLHIRSLDTQAKKILGTVNNETVIYSDDDYVIFLEEYTNYNPLGTKKKQYEKLVSLLRNSPRYLAKLGKNLPFIKLEDCVQIMMFSIYSDLHLVQEELLVLDFIKSVIAEEDFRGCKSADDLLRTNGFMTKVLSSYTKRESGRTHLCHCLKDPVQSLLLIDEELEIDPMKVWKKLHGPKKIDSVSLKSDQEVHKIVGNNRFKLNKYCKQFLDRVVSSLSTMPFGIRWIAKVLVKRAKEVYGARLSEREINLLIGGFIFLRYVSPAIISPEVHGIVEGEISVNQRRNLVLVAKVLQSLANDHKFQGKESYMEPMNVFLSATKSTLTKYLEQLIQIGDPEEHLGYLRTTSSSIKRAIVITPQELGELVQLIKTYESRIVSNANDPLTGVMKEIMSSVPAISLSDKKDKNALKRPTLLEVNPKTETVSHYVPGALPSIIELKSKFVTFLSRTKVDFTAAEGSELIEKLLRIHETCFSVDEPSTFIVFTEILKVLHNLGGSYQENNFEKLLSELEEDHDKRVQYYEYLLMDKIELLQAIEQHKVQIALLEEEKTMYKKYLDNAKRLSVKESFQVWQIKQNKRNKGSDTAVSPNSSFIAKSSDSLFDEETGTIKRFSK